MLSSAINLGQPVNWAAPLNRGLLCWLLQLPQNRGGSRLLDLCGQYHGTLTNGPTWKGSLGRLGGCGTLDFDGSDDYVLLPSAVPSVTRISFFSWLKPTAGYTSDFRSILRKGTSAYPAGRYWGADLRTTTGYVFVELRTGGTLRELTSTTALTADTWSHVGFTYDGSNLKSYVNGAEIATMAATGDVDATATAPILGTFSDIVGNVWYGGMDDVRLYNRGLSASDVVQLYTASRTGYRNELNWVQRRLVNSVSAPGGLSIPIAAYHYNHHLGSMAG